MAALNLSQNGPSIAASYQKIVGSSPAAAASASPTFATWAVFSVTAPLANAFQADAGRESVLSVQTTGEGELADLIAEFSDGRIQFAFVKLTDPNTALPKSVLIAWCGEGVPERTKGYFTSHLNAVARLLHGYHVQVTARSDRDLTPELIVQKVADASGAKYGGGGSVPPPASSGPPPPTASKPKPVLPTKTFQASTGFSPLGRTRAAQPAARTDADGWGDDAPPVTRSQLEKVAPAYQPTKVDMASLQTPREPSRHQPPPPAGNGSRADVVGGGYQPVGRVDIAAIRQQAQSSGGLHDDRPTVVKGAYEPVGKVDIAEIRRKAQGAPVPAPAPAPSPSGEYQPRSLADRSAAFTQSTPLTELPKPKVANRFGASAGNFSGTKAPAPVGFGSKQIQSSAPVGTASKTFADEGGKTPAQIWQEKKARQRGSSGAGDSHPSAHPASPPHTQAGDGWQSGYGGKKWDVQIPSRTGGSVSSEQRAGHDDPVREEPDIPSARVGSVRERFAGAPPMGAARHLTGGAPGPPPLDTASKPNAGARGVPVPGLPSRPAQDDVPAQQHQHLPTPPPRAVSPDGEEEDDDDRPLPQGSPIRVAMPVGRGADPVEPSEQSPPRALPSESLSQVASQHQDLEPEPDVQDCDPARGAARAAAASTFGQHEDTRGATGGHEAIAQYDYEKDEENELALQEGERIVNIEMVDDDWWMGENSKGEKGLFPSNYVELVQGGAGAGAGSGAAASAPAVFSAPHDSPAPSPPATQPAGRSLPTAVAEYDYEAAEENELSFPDGATIHNIEFPDDNWWSGEYKGKVGLFPANYVTLQE